jgi:hypothetical protein
MRILALLSLVLFSGCVSGSQFVVTVEHKDVKVSISPYIP